MSVDTKRAICPLLGGDVCSSLESALDEVDQLTKEVARHHAIVKEEQPLWHADVVEKNRLKGEVDRLSKESFDYRDAWMELSAKHEALLAAAKEWERWNPPQQVTAPHIEGLRAAIADCGGDDDS